MMCWHCGSPNPYHGLRDTCYACARPPKERMPAVGPRFLRGDELRKAIGYTPINSQMSLRLRA